MMPIILLILFLLPVNVFAAAGFICEDPQSVGDEATQATVDHCNAKAVERHVNVAQTTANVTSEGDATSSSDGTSSSGNTKATK